MLNQNLVQQGVDQDKSKSSRSSRLALGLIVALSLVNMLLIWQNFSLRKQLQNSGSRSTLAERSLKAGETVPSVSGEDIQGQPHQLLYENDGRRHLVLFFSPSCGYCKKQAPLWRAMLDGLDSTRFNVVGVVSDREDMRAVSEDLKTSGYLSINTPLPIMVFSEQYIKSYKLVGTPTTLLIDDSGKVMNSWIGMWDEDQAREVAFALK